MNIITGKHENVLLVPTRALLVDQALIVKHDAVKADGEGWFSHARFFGDHERSRPWAIMSSSLIRIAVCVPKAVRQRVIRPPKEENAK